MSESSGKSQKLANLSRVLFIYALCALSFILGYLSLANNWFPHRLIVETKFLIDELREPINRELYVETDQVVKVPIYDPDAANNGLSLLTSAIDDNKLAVSVITMDGELIHQWDTDWFDLWPDATHISKSDPMFPKSRPGANIHGVLLLENGDLIFNFEYLGLVRLDVCGEVIWKLPHRVHHSIYLDENNVMWIPSRIVHTEPVPELPYHIPPFDEPTVLKVSLDGQVLGEISVLDILRENDLDGLLYLSSLGKQEVNASGDILHLNDVETFPGNMEEGFFKTGDIMLSLRNINTILIVREDDLQVTQVSTGPYIRQHDPDFVDGNTISVFDNIAPEVDKYQSRILIQSFPDREKSVYYTGNEETPFFSSILGNHQWLPNGNLLITDSMAGRAIEIDQGGKIIWEYVNLIRPGYAGVVEDLQRLPDSFTAAYFEQLTKQCQPENGD